MASTRPPPPSRLIATLGSEPQVVTATLDLLLQMGESIRHVSVIHTVAPNTPLATSLEIMAT